jgi:hypothetical protein
MVDVLFFSFFIISRSLLLSFSPSLVPVTLALQIGEINLAKEHARSAKTEEAKRNYG